MTADKLQRFLDGSLGLFWPSNEIPELSFETATQGFIQLSNGRISTKTLNHEPMQGFDEDARSFHGMLAATDNGGAIVFNPVRTGIVRVFGGSHLSTITYSAQALAYGIEIGGVVDFKTQELSVEFLGVSRFSGQSATTLTTTTDESGKTKSASVLLESPDPSPESVPLKQNISLQVQSHWRTSGELDNLTLLAPTRFVASATHARRLTDLLEPLMAVQDLLSLVYMRHVPASSASLAPNLTREAQERSRDEKADFWSTHLFIADPSTQSFQGRDDEPLVDLATLGDSIGLARWCRLAEEHPRPVVAVCQQYRLGPLTAGLLLREVAAAMESWVRSFHQEPHGGYVQTLAAEVGDPFTKWVGDHESWSRAFWSANNQLKHRRSSDPAPENAALLATSGRHLMAAALLNHAAASGGPGEMYFSSHRLSNLGNRLRESFPTT